MGAGRPPTLAILASYLPVARVLGLGRMQRPRSPCSLLCTLTRKPDLNVSIHVNLYLPCTECNIKVTIPYSNLANRQQLPIAPRLHRVKREIGVRIRSPYIQIAGYRATAVAW